MYKAGPTGNAVPPKLEGVKTYGKHRFPGRLFVVEGIDGSGKSTQLALL